MEPPAQQGRDGAPERSGRSRGRRRPQGEGLPDAGNRRSSSSRAARNAGPLVLSASAVGLRGPKHLRGGGPHVGSDLRDMPSRGRPLAGPPRLEIGLLEATMPPGVSVCRMWPASAHARMLLESTPMKAAA